MSEEQEIKKAKLVIIGNGFDLAHGYKTSYKDFLCYLLNKRILEFKNDTASHHHGLKGEIGFSVVQINTEVAVNAKKQINRGSYARERDNNQKIINNFHSRTKKKATEMDILSKFTEKKSLQEIRTFLAELKSYIKPKFSELIQAIYNDANINNWVDVEEVYYRLLRKQLIEVESGDEERRDEARQQIKALNKSLQYLQEKLQEYLLQEIKKTKTPLEEMKKKFYVINRDEFNKVWRKYQQLIVLNFNYTSIINEYNLVKGEVKNQVSGEIEFVEGEILNIHGELTNSNNPIIFGVGDENHDDYKKLEESNIDDFLINVKSIKYLETHNYTNLINALNEHDEFDVDILGHSCGISDRTLLKEIFELEECRKIYIHHYPTKGDNGLQNYKDISYGISRYFKNNQKMREKVQPFNPKLTIPQAPKVTNETN